MCEVRAEAGGIRKILSALYLKVSQGIESENILLGCLSAVTHLAPKTFSIGMLGT